MVIIADNLNFKSTTKLNSKREQFRSELFRFLEKHCNSSSPILNYAPNRVGKTISTLEFHITNINEIKQLYIGKAPRILYLSDRHKQISEVQKTLLEKYSFSNFNHIWAIEYLCKRKEEDTIKKLIDDNVSAGVICNDCKFKNSCQYHLQFNFEDGFIVGSPKEFLISNRIQKKPWNTIIFDELLDVAHKIKPVCPEISEETFDSYGLQRYLDFYITLNGILQDMKQHECTLKFPNSVLDPMKAELDNSKAILKKNSFIDLKRLTDLAKEDSELMEGEIKGPITFLNGLTNTLDWFEYSFKYGFRTHFFRPYIHYAMDISKRNNAVLNILNTSLERHIYDSLVSTYKTKIPEPLEFPFDIKNKNNLLLHYNQRYRSCPKWTIFEMYEDEEGKWRILKDKEGFPVTNNYGKEITYMAMSIAAYCRNLGLKIGLITFKDAKNVLRGCVDVVDHFGGHQGSNKFDDVDVLIILGTYHRPPAGLYKAHYIINNEFLKDNPAKWINPEFINGVRINFTDNEGFNEVIRYKLNEEQEQAIFRNGSHVEDGKIVIVFGYVPNGIEDKLDYRVIKSAQGAKMSINRWFKKFETT